MSRLQIVTVFGTDCVRSWIDPSRSRIFKLNEDSVSHKGEAEKCEGEERREELHTVVTVGAGRES